MLANTINAAHYTLTISKANRPYKNSFTQKRASIIQLAGEDIIDAVVVCTERSEEPGRIYACYFNTKGKLIACDTLN